jgi:Lon protease-like protein
MVQIETRIGSQAAASEHRSGDAWWFSTQLADPLPLGNQIKQKMLELTDANMHLDLIERFLGNQGLVALNSGSSYFFGCAKI